MRQGIRFPFLIVSLMLGLSAWPWAEAHAQTAPKPVPLKVGIIKIASCTPAYAAKKYGFFAKNGIDAELVEFVSGSVSIMAQQSGRVDVVLSIPGNVFVANERGFDLTAISGMELSQMA